MEYAVMQCMECRSGGCHNTLAGRDVVGVGLAVEASAVDYLYLDAFEAGVARYEGVRRVIEAGRGRVHEGIVDELGAVGIGNSHALTTVFSLNVLYWGRGELVVSGSSFPS